MPETSDREKLQQALRTLLECRPRVINVGLPALEEALRRQGVEVVQVDWRPPRLEVGPSAETVVANEQAWGLMQAVRPRLVGVRPAGTLVSDWPAGTLLHPGPALPEGPIPPGLRPAAVAACCAEGWAGDAAEVDQRQQAAKVAWQPSFAWNAALPANTLLSPSRLVFLVKDEGDRQAWGPVWSSPASSPAERDDRRSIARAIDRALMATGGLDLAELVARGLEAGAVGYAHDDAGRGLFLLHLLPAVLDGAGEPLPPGWLALLGRERSLYQHLLLPMARLLADATVLPHTSLVTAMGGNGRGFGVRIGDRWTILPAAPPALADRGDEPLLEVVGLGAMALAASPALARRLALSPAQGVRSTLEMYEISEGESARWRIPLLDGRGLPSGLDGWRVLEMGILPPLVDLEQGRLLTVPEQLFRAGLAAG